MKFGTNLYPIYRQPYQLDCGPACLKIITKHDGKDYNLECLRQISNLRIGGEALAGTFGSFGRNCCRRHRYTIRYEELVNGVPLPGGANLENNNFLVVHREPMKYIYILFRFRNWVSQVWSYGICSEMGIPRTIKKNALLLVEPNRNFTISKERIPSTRDWDSGLCIYCHLRFTLANCALGFYLPL
ncbi:cysteine peptidase family C39 domain-containing protein [Arenibacter sp. F26102]|uniref:cysteine peptidase family C39 domain-containing protein n=1 Tax=Arenibacter sp. F26102 TaxID=2926416 RepID=UPI001FF29224|nr:cysteine peptidase family C39 domain-containing protein [Arenibacter sp. F26102]MCK0148251.1 cysteine peptidase family C39 domain-containing protein [Arenibacter sp. F26102]